MRRFIERALKQSLLATTVLALFGAAGPAAAQDLHGGPCAPQCRPPCCDECKPICRPEIAIRKVPKVFYDCKCEPFCLPKCICPKFGDCHKDCCDPCAVPCAPCAECEKPRMRKVLIKYIKERDEPFVKCTPELVLVPKCSPPPCGAPVIVSPHAPSAPPKPAGELLPPPKVEGK